MKPYLDKCWCWCGAANGRTGMFGYEGNTYTPQRMSLYLYKGIELKNTKGIYRTCGYLPCVNPAHLSIKG